MSHALATANQRPRVLVRDAGTPATGLTIGRDRAAR